MFGPASRSWASRASVFAGLPVAASLQYAPREGKVSQTAFIKLVDSTLSQAGLKIRNDWTEVVNTLAAEFRATK